MDVQQASALELGSAIYARSISRNSRLPDSLDRKLSAPLPHYT